MSYLHVQRFAVISDEYQGTYVAVEYAITRWNAIHPELTAVLATVKRAQIHLAQQNISDTYIVRAFSEFEDILRQEVGARGYTVPYKTEALTNRAALMSKAPNNVRLDAHRVREYRNAIVHRTASPIRPMLFGETFGLLNKFLARL